MANLIRSLIPLQRRNLLPARSRMVCWATSSSVAQRLIVAAFTHWVRFFSPYLISHLLPSSPTPGLWFVEDCAASMGRKHLAKAFENVDGVKVGWCFFWNHAGRY